MAVVNPNGLDYFDKGEPLPIVSMVATGGVDYFDKGEWLSVAVAAPAGGGSVTVTPSQQTLTLTLHVPTVTATRFVTVAPAQQILTLTLQTPTVSATRTVTVTPTLQTLTITLQVPTVTATRFVTITPTLQTLTITLQAPSVSAGGSVTVTPTLQTLTLSLFAPTISASGATDVTVTPTLQTLTLTLLAPFAETYQIARPIADVSVGTWTTDTGATSGLYATLDESTANDADYIQSTSSPASWEETRVRLASMVDPDSEVGHALRFRYQKDSGIDRIDLMVSLYRADGTTLITQVGYADIGTSVLDGVIELNAVNANAIPSTDYAIGLVVGFAAIENTGGGGGLPPWF